MQKLSFIYPYCRLINKGRAGYSESCKSGSRGEAPETYRSNAARRWGLSLLNSVAFTDGRKYRSTPATYYYDVRGTSDELCNKYGLSVIEPTGRGQEYAEWKAAHEGEKTKRDRVREDIDACIARSATFSEWVKNMRALRYIIDFDRKHTRIFRPEGGKAFRLSSLGKEYTEDVILRRILSNDDPLPPLPPQTPKKRVAYQRVRLPRRRFRRAILFRGIQAQYCRYMFRFDALPVKRLPRLKLDRLDEKRFEDTAKRLKMLCDNRITNTAQLSAFKSSQMERLPALDSQRKQLQNKKRSAKTLAELSGLDAQVDRLSRQIREIRATCRMCDQTAVQEAEIREGRERMHQFAAHERNDQHKRRNNHVR